MENEDLTFEEDLFGVVPLNRLNKNELAHHGLVSEEEVTITMVRSDGRSCQVNEWGIITPTSKKWHLTVADDSVCAASGTLAECRRARDRVEKNKGVWIRHVPGYLIASVDPKKNFRFLRCAWSVITLE